jgi:hypothetical protein
MRVLWRISVGPEVCSVGANEDNRLSEGRRIQLASQFLIMLKVDGILYLLLVGWTLFLLHPIEGSHQAILVLIKDCRALNQRFTERSECVDQWQ